MNKQKIFSKHMKRFLTESGLINGYFPSQEGVINVVGKKRSTPLRILYGETYDFLGITIDSLRYYLFLWLLHRFLQNAGVVVESTVLIADTASAINPSAGDTQRIFDEGKKRLDQLNAIIETYHLPIRIQLMSELFEQQNTQQLIYDVQKIVADSQEIQGMLQKTVLQNRVHQEQKASYKYGAEAIATALLFDVKIGPPREQFYDEVAAIIAKKLKRERYGSIYLTPTYPLGLDFVYFLLHPEIEVFGVTPYKAGSNGLQENRIVLGKTPLDKVELLIRDSFVPKQKNLPNPTRDVLDISRLARLFLQKKNYETHDDMKKMTLELYRKNIDEPLKQFLNI